MILRGCLFRVVRDERNADANARRTVDRLGFDQGRDGEHIRAYQLKCVSGFFRAIETYRKYQAKKPAEGRERTDEHPTTDGEGPSAATWRRITVGRGDRRFASRS